MSNNRTLDRVPISERETMNEATKCLGSTNAKIRETQVPAEIVRLEKAIEDLGITQERLFDRLTHVSTSPNVPAGPAGSAQMSPDDELVPMADHIRTLRRRVESMTYRSESVTQRLEV